MLMRLTELAMGAALMTVHSCLSSLAISSPPDAKKMMVARGSIRRHRRMPIPNCGRQIGVS
jgi:hypothetical protein